MFTMYTRSVMERSSLVMLSKNWIISRKLAKGHLNYLSAPSATFYNIIRKFVNTLRKKRNGFL